MANKLARIAWYVLSSGKDYGKEAALGKHRTLSHFSTTTGFIDVQRSAEERRKAKQRSNGVPENLHIIASLAPRGLEGPTRADHYRLPGERFSPLKGRMHLRGLSFAQRQRVAVR
jgi:hypothetical protein